MPALMIHSFIALLLAVFIVGCDSSPPELMAATKVFETEQETKLHVAEMRTNHMHLLNHKRDETMYSGIRTAKHSLNACIDCHVPTSHNGKVLRHTDQEHFCTTCHTYVAAKLNCFECHVDHPVETNLTTSYKTKSLASKKPLAKEEATVILNKKTNSEIEKIISVADVLEGKDLSKLSKQDLIDLAFTYSKYKPKQEKTSVEIEIFTA